MQQQPNDTEARSAGAIESGEQHIELPKGGGALESTGEKFEPDPFTGAGSVSVPIALTEGRGEFTPQLQLSYSSGSGNSPFSLGWNLGTATIKRKTAKGLPRYNDTLEADTFIMAGAEDLVPLMEQVNGDWIRKTEQEGDYDVLAYRPRTESGFSRIERHLHRPTGISHWKVTDRENITRIYGRDAEARISHPDDPKRIFKWFLQEKYDSKGNVIRYKYKEEDSVNVDNSLHEKNRLKYGKSNNQKYLKRVLYGNSIPYDPADSNFDSNVKWHFQLVLDYGDHDELNPQVQADKQWTMRSDAFSSFKSGFEIRTRRLCRRILMFHHFDELGTNPYLVKSTELTYDHDPANTLLKEVQHKCFQDGEQPAPFPPVTFSYTKPEADDKLRSLPQEDLRELPGGIDGNRFRWKDLYGEGIQGILAESGNGWYFKHNRGDTNYYDDRPASELPEPEPSFDRFRPVVNKPHASGMSGNTQRLTDIDGDGLPELVVYTQNFNGYFKQDRSTADKSGQWKTFIPFAGAPAINYDDPNLRMIDLTGNGHADILITTDHCYRWYPAKGGASGYGSPLQTVRHHNDEEGPSLLFADGSQSVHLADMTGDGLTDLVRITNNRVDYWPNTGYGNFGHKISMDNSPHLDHPDQFNPARIRLNDIDGNGTTDILYVRGKETVYWKNNAGNTFSGEQKIHSLPPVTDHTTVNVTDLFGNGTSCLVWSSPLPGHNGLQVRYIMLAGRDKPFMLKEMNNNTGGVQRFRFAPSTRFYLRDKRNGTPWVTKLPFPVQVLERHEVKDEITNTRFVSRYAYHHGYFDPYEREFRGFGMVEQWDGEQYQHFAAGGLFGAGASNEDEPSHIPPVHSKTWFHTGTWRDHLQLMKQYEKEYFAGDENFEAPGETQFPQNLSTEESRDAFRNLKGSILRQEIYADDQTDDAGKPYTVTVESYRIEKLQPSVHRKSAKAFDLDAEHARHYTVLQLLPAHEVTYDYDRKPEDPRIAHRAVLQTDDFGNITRSAQIVYPRRGSGHDPEQTQYKVTFKDKSYINKPDESDFYLLGLPKERKLYELTGFSTPSGLFTREQLNTDFESATEIPFEQEPATGLEKRLYKRRRTTYYNNDLTGELSAGEAAFHGKVYRTYKLVLTQGMIDNLYNDNGTLVDNNLMEEAGYHRFNTSEWDGAAEEDFWWKPSERMVHDVNKFYMPVEIIDPFDNSTTLEYDDPCLMLEKSMDALGNERTAENDYRVMQPWRLTGINGNRREVAFDVRGMVVAKAVRGKPSEGLGDTLSDPTEKFDYNLFNWMDNALPVYAHSEQREEHGSGNNRWIEHYVYTGGLGEAVMEKHKVAPGDAFERDVNGELILDGNGDPVLAHTDPRWVGTGRTVYNNKGEVVKQYEPYFSSVSDYEDEDELVEYGVTPVMHYDPVGRVTRVDQPDGTFEKTIYNPWKHEHHDRNDTVMDSQWYIDRGSPDPQDPEPSAPETRAAWLAAKHHGTPDVVHLDTSGQPYKNIQQGYDASENIVNFDTEYEFDMRGKHRKTTNPLDQEIRMDYDLRPTEEPDEMPVRIDHPDSGLKRILYNASGEAVRQWDSLERTYTYIYDELHRPKGVKITDSSSNDHRWSLFVYGDDAGLTSPENDNLRGKVVRVFDQSGMTKTDAYDFKGNPLSQVKRLPQDYQNTIDWTDVAAKSNLTDIDNEADNELESETFNTSQTFDALNRVTESTKPDGSKVIRSFDAGGVLNKVELDHAHGSLSDYMEDIKYNARGQKTKVYLGNNTLKHFTYDEQTFRIKRILTTRNSGQDILQDLNYTYDPVGNITEITDDAQQTFYFDNSVVSPTTKYRYDPAYRLIEAKGREAANNDQPSGSDIPAFIGFPYNNSSAEVENYTQKYRYDKGGNIIKMIHTSNSGNWTRGYHYDTSTNNHLLKTSATGDDPEDHNTYSHHYTHDARGNMTSMPHLSDIKRNLKDEISEVDLGGGGTVWYQYDESGQRVRKVWDTGNKKRHRIYIGDYEVWREYDGTTLENERETLHVNGEEKRFALVETQTIEAWDPVNNVTIRYQYGNQLESACLELNEDAELLTYEEYHPFGTSSIRMGTSQAEVSLKRYRYNGKERDEETGLYYYGARYYAAWLGRFLRVDPEWKSSPTLTSFHYVSNNPVNRVDPDGRQDEESEDNQNSMFRTVVAGPRGETDPNLFLTLILQEDEIPEYFKKLGIEKTEQLENYVKRKPIDHPSGDIGQKVGRSRISVLIDQIPGLIRSILDMIQPGERKESMQKLHEDSIKLREDFMLFLSLYEKEGIIPDILSDDQFFASDLFNYLHAGDMPSESGYGEAYDEAYNEIIQEIGDYAIANEGLLRNPSFNPRQNFIKTERDFSHFDNASSFDELTPFHIISLGTSLENILAPDVEVIENVLNPSSVIPPKRKQFFK